MVTNKLFKPLIQRSLAGSLRHRKKVKNKSKLAASIAAILACSSVITLSQSAFAQSPLYHTTVPSTLQAEDYDIGSEGIAYHDADTSNNGGQYRQDGVDIEFSSNGGFNVGWVNDGEWLNYTISVPEAGTYSLEALVASQGGGGEFYFEINGATQTQSTALTFSDTGGWQNWITTNDTEVELNAGEHTLRLVVNRGGFNIDSITVNQSVTLVQGPFSGAAISIPGVIQTEDYDVGGPDVAYYDRSEGNAFGHYRSDNVDIEAGAAGGQHVGWVEQGEWMEYTIDVSESGVYDFSARVASENSGGALHFEVAGQASAVAGFSGTGGWQNWANSPTVTMPLPAGQHVLRIMIDSGEFNVDSVNISASGTNETVQDPYLGTATAIPGTIQAENYDLGGSDIAYYDRSEGNAFGSYRTDNVDIEAGSGGGQHIGWVEQGEWVEYTIDVAEDAEYNLSAVVASESAGGGLHFEVDGQASSMINFSGTGGWQNWANSDSSILALTAGQHVLRMVIDWGEFNVDSFTLIPNSVEPPLDSDNDGFIDSEDAFPFDPAEWLDTDSDGVGDNADAFPTDPSETTDTDGDGVGDNADAFPNNATETTDTDGNGIGNNTDNNDDGDACLDVDDAFPLDPARGCEEGLTLVWSDDFDNINFDNWSHDVGGEGWGNSELQYYTDGNNVSTTFDAQANSHVLVMEARRENPNNYQCWYGTCEYTSSKLISADKQVFMHGRIEGRMKVPQTQGIWAAFWMLGTNLHDVGWPRSGEIDIMEHVGQEPTINHGALHGLGYSGSTPIFGTNDLGESIDENFHVFAVDWDENGITWSVDDVEFYSVTRQEVEAFGNWAFDHEFYVILNVAVGGTWPGSPAGGSYPQQMLVDYVKVYQDLGANQGSDVDGDGYTDDIDAFPTNPEEWLDSDGDGMGDNEDAFPFDPTETIDTDLDGIGNNADLDDDNDGCLDVDDLSPLDPDTCDLPVHDAVVPIFTEGVGLTNGFTWQFWSWDIINHSVTNPDGSTYTVGGPARLNMAGGSSIPFEKADRTDTDIDAAGAQSFNLTYSSEKPFEVLLLWGVTPEGWAAEGYPYWSATNYLEGGFLQVFVPASSETTEFSIDFEDIDNPVNKYFVEEEGMPAAVVDTTKMQMLLFKSSDELVNVTINNVQFGEGTIVAPVDTDGDGIVNTDDAFPEDPLEWLDTDLDGIGNNADLDDDNDGYNDSDDFCPLDPTCWEEVIDTGDSDGDGFTNNVDAFPNDANEWFDSDLDGTGDNADAFPFDDTETTDTDGDGTGDNADACPLDSDPACIAEPGFNCDEFDLDCVAIFDSETGLLNGFTWRFWTWTDTHNVTALDGSVYAGSGPARLNMAPGTSIPFEQDDTTMSEVDASATEAFRLTYSSEEPFEVLILWGGPVAGWTEPGYPYWTDSTYMDGGFLLVQVPASTEVTEFAMDFADMPAPVNEYFVNQLGMAEATTDLTEVQMLLLKNSGKEELVSVVIYEMAFGESGPGPVDTDGDGVFDSKDAFPLDPSEWIDSDGDGTGNNADNNDDGDSCLDIDDAYPLDATRCEAQDPTDFLSYPGYTGIYPNFTLMIDDRFDALDSSVWETGDGGFNENACRFQPEGVQFNNGSMELVITEQAVDASNSVSNGNQMVAAKDYTCGELRTKDTYLYGRIEARIRTPNPEVASGYISSLFTYLNDADDGFRWREIDIEMEGARPTKFQRNLIYGEGTWNWNDTRAWGAYEEVIEIGSTSDWRVYAIEWTETEILWYVDGVLQSTLTMNEVNQFGATIPELASKIMMNFWIPNDQIQNAFGGNKGDNVYPMVAEYDWFRYYAWDLK